MASNYTVMPNDMSDLCRVCLTQPDETQYLDLTTIYDEDDHLTYSDCFTICTQIDLKSGIGVPHHLCKSCGLELQMSYDFHKKVEESKRVIQQYEKKMQEYETNGQDLLLKPLPQKDARKDQPKHPDEQQFLLSSMVAEEFHSPQEIPKVTQDELEYLTNSEEENGVELLSKITLVKYTDQVKNEHLVPMEECIEIEEHLEADDFQNLETLEEEETETLQIKCAENTVPITKYKNKPLKEEEFFFVEEVEEEENYQTNSQEDPLDDEEESNEYSKWQENVVAVANKEHIPVETEEEEENDNEVEEFKYTKDDDYVILNEASGDENNAKEKDKKKKRKKRDIISVDGKIIRHFGSYSCDYCQKMFKNFSRMKAHRRCHEVDRTKYGCVHCGRLYATKQAMECHVQTAHEKLGYSCNICSKIFAIRKSLEIHMRYHTGEFPYACDLCDKKFAQACHLNTHKNVKHNSIRFSCDYPDCGKFFTSTSSLRSHEYSHGLMPFECEHCQQGYPTKSKLKVHIKRKHGFDLNLEQLEHMRKFHVMRSKVKVVKVLDVEAKT